MWMPGAREHGGGINRLLKNYFVCHKALKLPAPMMFYYNPLNIDSIDVL